MAAAEGCLCITELLMHALNPLPVLNLLRSTPAAQPEDEEVEAEEEEQPSGLRRALPRRGSQRSGGSARHARFAEVEEEQEEEEEPDVLPTEEAMAQPPSRSRPPRERKLKALFAPEEDEEEAAAGEQASLAVGGCWCLEWFWLGWAGCLAGWRMAAEGVLGAVACTISPNRAYSPSDTTTHPSLPNTSRKRMTMQTCTCSVAAAASARRQWWTPRHSCQQAAGRRRRKRRRSGLPGGGAGAECSRHNCAGLLRRGCAGCAPLPEPATAVLPPD